MGAVITTANDARPCVNEWKPTGDGRWVNKYSILGTNTTAYAVWEPYRQGIVNGVWRRSHSTITHRGPVCLGDVTMRELPAELDALPYGEERVHAVRAWYAANKEEARALVKEVYPQDFE